MVKAGFNSQEFEPSPLDDLSKLELTPDEQQIDTNPVAQQQYQYIQYAVANKSLGFSFQVHPMIQQFINYYRGRGRSTMEIGLYRSGMFMRMARRIFKEEGVPENVAWLAQVESTGSRPPSQPRPHRACGSSYPARVHGSACSVPLTWTSVTALTRQLVLQPAI